MASDFAPDLYDKIWKVFQTSVKRDKKLGALIKRLKTGTASQSDVARFAERIGRHASGALQGVLTVDALPDGALGYALGKETAGRLLMENHRMVNRAATLQQEAVYQQAGIGIAVSTGQDPALRIRKICRMAANATTQTELANALNLPVVSTVRKFHDDFLKANSEMREGLGFEESVVRTYDGVGLKAGACEWCIERAGTYNSYGDAEEAGAFERHPGCGCTIEVVTRKGEQKRQTDWKRNQWA